MTVQTVRPAGAGHETGMVLAACIVIVLLTTLAIMMRTTPEASVQVSAGQIDARHGLKAAEQGVYADLLVAADEITREDNPPDISALAAQMIPPFSTDASSARRGGHVWRMRQDSTAIVYIGVTRDPDISGSLLLRLPLTAARDHQHSPAPEPAQVWLHKAADVQSLLPDSLDQGSLLRNGWRQIVSRFDAGATRHQH